MGAAIGRGHELAVFGGSHRRGLSGWLGNLRNGIRISRTARAAPDAYHARHLASRMPESRQLDTETLAVMWGVVISYLLLGSIIAAAIIPGRVLDIIQWIFGLS